jgi:hypothetical protein
MWIVVLALSCSLSGDPTPVAAHVRAASPVAQTLITEASTRSAIVNDLIDHLERTDTIVYVDIAVAPETALARTKLVASSPGARFLRISINARVPWWDRVALLAHELRHAVEIADANDVKDDEGVRRLYTRIGFPGGANQYETTAARETEWRVRAEVARRP